MASSSGLTFKLHPVVYSQISDYWTRAKSQLPQSADSPRVHGCVIGLQRGRTVEIFNSFELLYDPATLLLGGLHEKQELYKLIYPNFHLLGWYSTGRDAGESDIHIYEALRGIIESPVFILANPSIDRAQKEAIPVSIYECELCLKDGTSWLEFVHASYTIETIEPERMLVDNVVHLEPSDGGTTATQLDVMHKNRLQEYTQKMKTSYPIYNTTNEGSQQAPRFRSTVYVGGDRFNSSKTFSHKKQAEQYVAQIALHLLTGKMTDEGCGLIHELNGEPSSKTNWTLDTGSSQQEKRGTLVKSHAGNKSASATGKDKGADDASLTTPSITESAANGIGFPVTSLKLLSASEKHSAARVVQDVTAGNISSSGVRRSLHVKLHSQVLDTSPTKKKKKTLDTSEGSLLGGAKVTEIMQIEENENLNVEVEAEGDTNPSRSPALTFVKMSPIWKAVESWDVFQKLTQAPHFPLSNNIEQCELAFAKIVTFAITLQMASKLEITDSRSRFTTCLADLVELEADGFDVQEIKSHLMMLLSMKDEHDKLKKERDEAETHITGLENEKVKIAENIEKIIEKRRHLEDKLKLALADKGKKDSEIKILRNCVDVKHNMIQSALHDFEKCLNNFVRVRSGGSAGDTARNAGEYRAF